MAKNAAEITMPPVPTIMERVAAHPEPWNPNDEKAKVPNPVVIRLLDRNVAHSNFGTYPIFECVDHEGNFWTLHAFHTALRNALEGLPMMSVVVIRRDEKSELGNGQTFWKYRVVVAERADSEVKSEVGSEEPW